MRIVSQLVGRNNNGCESAMMLRIIVHHGLNAARGKHATRRARLAAHHQYDRHAGLCLAVASAAGGRYTSAFRASKCDAVAGIFTFLTSPCAGILLTLPSAFPASIA